MKIVEPEVIAVGHIKEEMMEKRPLPIGRTQFMEWSDRIISGAMVEASIRSQRFALATMLLHMGSTESFKEDAFFIHSLRKGAVNETASYMMKEIKDEQDAEKKRAEDTAPKLGVVDGGLLENTDFSDPQ